MRAHLLALTLALSSLPACASDAPAAASRPDTVTADDAAEVPGDAGDAVAPDADGVEPPGDVAMVGCQPGGTIAPVPAGDVTYETWPAAACGSFWCPCDEAARPRLEALLACDAVLVGFYWDFGAIVLRVAGRQGDRCVLDVTLETEGGVQVLRCEPQLPLSFWPGLGGPISDAADALAGIEASCTTLGQCSIANPGDPCDALDPAWCPPGGFACGPTR